MNENYENKSNIFFSERQNKNLENHKADIEKIANSADGQRVQQLLEGSDLSTAFEKGDINALRAALGKVLSTSEGQRLVKGLSDIVKE